MKISVLATSMLLAWLMMAAAGAQTPPEGRGDPFAGRLFPPELILSNQSRLGLDDDQRRAIMEQMQAFQSQIIPLQWELQSAMEALRAELDMERIREEQALAGLATVMEIESQVKRHHLRLVIRIKNTLTPEQVATLEALTGRAGAE